MQIAVLKSKIAYAKITATELYYEGSITIDSDIMKAAGLREYEQVQVLNVNNGERLETYVIAGEPGSRIFALNGPAARKAAVGDAVHILTYALIDVKEPVVKPIVLDLRLDQ